MFIELFEDIFEFTMGNRSDVKEAELLLERLDAKDKAEIERQNRLLDELLGV